MNIKKLEENEFIADFANTTELFAVTFVAPTIEIAMKTIRKFAEEQAKKKETKFIYSIRGFRDVHKTKNYSQPNPKRILCEDVEVEEESEQKKTIYLV